MKAKLIWSFGVSLVTGKNIGKYVEIIKQKSETKINASVTRGTKGNLVPKPEFGNTRLLHPLVRPYAAV